jgi:zinc D-Ala-D-Ala dipeptidase
MMRILGFLLVFCSITSHALPRGFVCLDDYAPDILQDMRYATYHNFIGRPIAGYREGRCILTEPAARQLAKAEAAFKPLGYRLKVYDCYRPKRAVRDFITWSQKTNQQSMKAEFYPNVDKRDFFKKGYVAKYSGHSRGSTVDLTWVKLPLKEQEKYARNQALEACYAPVHTRFRDNSIDYGYRI